MTDVIEPVRQVATVTEAAPRGGGIPTGGPTAGGFGQALLQALERLDAAQRQADAMAVGFAAGQTDDIAQVMLAGERARLALQLAATIRDRVVESFKELLRTPL